MSFEQTVNRIACIQGYFPRSITIAKNESSPEKFLLLGSSDAVHVQLAPAPLLTAAGVGEAFSVPKVSCYLAKAPSTYEDKNSFLTTALNLGVRKFKMTVSPRLIRWLLCDLDDITLPSLYQSHPTIKWG